MKRNPTVNVITAILAVLLSIALVITAFGAVIFHMLSSATKADNITDFVQNIDYSAFLPDGETIAAAIGDFQVDENVVAEIIDSQAVEEVVGQYTEEFSAVLSGEQADGLSVEKILQITDENMDELVTIFQENTDLEIDEQELRSQISKTVEENAPAILESLPTPQALLEEMDPQVTNTLKTVFDPQISMILLLISLGLAALIYACRYYRFGGFLWIGIDCAVSAALVGLVFAVLNLAKSLLIGILPLDLSVVDAAVSVLNRSLLIGLLILIGAAVLFIVLGAVLRTKASPKNEPEAFVIQE